MNRINRVFNSLKMDDKKGFIPFIVGGYPDLSSTEEAIYTLADAGADVIEIGIPFSDPVADGPVIQAASYEALLKGVNLDKLFALVKRVRKKIETPIVFMSYYNPLLNFGLHNIALRAKDAGVDGFIVPDLPPEDALFFKEELSRRDICLIFLVTINSSEERVKKIVSMSTGFIYLVSRLGVTGMASIDDKPVKIKIEEIRKYTNTPIAVGFGVSKPSDAKIILKYSDAVIVGSAIVKMMHSSNKNTQKQLFDFVREFKRN